MGNTIRPPIEDTAVGGRVGERAGAVTPKERSSRSVFLWLAEHGVGRIEALAVIEQRAGLPVDGHLPRVDPGIIQEWRRISPEKLGQRHPQVDGDLVGQGYAA